MEGKEGEEESPNSEERETLSFQDDRTDSHSE